MCKAWKICVVCEENAETISPHTTVEIVSFLSCCIVEKKKLLMSSLGWGNCLTFQEEEKSEQQRVKKRINYTISCDI